MLKTTIKPVSRTSDIVVQNFDNEVLIYDLTENKAFSLNETSALVWQLCDGHKTVSEIAKSLSEKLKSPISEDFVMLALEQLKRDNLLENASEVSTDFGGLSRREVIRKVGFASLVALPVISSLVAPLAVQAASACGGNCRCTNATVSSCNGSTATVGGVSYVNCFTTSGNNSACNCVGPFNANDSAGSGFKSSTVGCRLT